MKTTHTTPSGKIVTLETYTVGINFGTGCEIRSRNGRRLATLDEPSPLGFVDSAIGRGRELADSMFPAAGAK